MGKVIFYPPNGSDYENPADEIINDWVINKTQSDWDSGSCDGSFHYQSNDFLKSELILALKEPYGFFVMYRCNRDENENAISNGGDLDDMITINPGGEPWELPSVFFNTRTKVLEAVRYFIKSGEMLSSVKWVNLWEGWEPSIS